MAEVVVVGAGVGGLAAAARLASVGHRVTVLTGGDRQGRSPTTLRRDGFAFDVGSTGLTLPAVYRDLFLKTARRRADAALEDNVHLRLLDPATEYRWPNGTRVRLPGTNPKRAAAALGVAFGDEAQSDWTALSRHGAEAWSTERQTALAAPGLAAPGPAPVSRRRWSMARRTATGSLHDVGADTLRDPRLRTLLADVASRRGVDPRDAPATSVAVPYVEQSFGTWHVGGGIGVLLDALVARCRQHGVVLRAAAAEALLVDSDTAVGVRCADRTTFRGDAVVVERPVLGADRTVTVLLALRGRTASLAPVTVLLPGGHGVWRHGAVRVFAPDDPAMRPDDDHEAWSVSVVVDGPTGHQPDGPLVGQLLDRLAAAGLDVRDRLVHIETVPPVSCPHPPLLPDGPVAGLLEVGAPRAASALPFLGLPYPGLDAERVAAQLGRG